VLVLLSYVIGPLTDEPGLLAGRVVMMLISTLTAALVTTSGRSAWFVGVLTLMVYLTLRCRSTCCRRGCAEMRPARAPHPSHHTAGTTTPRRAISARAGADRPRLRDPVRADHVLTFTGR